MEALNNNQIITKIAKRAVNWYKQNGEKVRFGDVKMDLTVCHACNPLDLVAMLEGDDFNFMHDISGINKHLDHNTFKLTGSFLPRFSK